MDCVGILDRYLTELRRYMVKYPWPAVGDTSSLEHRTEEEVQEGEWEELQTEVMLFHSLARVVSLSLLPRLVTAACLLDRK